MPAIPSVTLTLQDNGSSAAVSVPQSSVQLKIGCAIGGVVNQPFATTSPTSLQQQFVGGPLLEAGGLVCQAGNVCVAISCPIVTAGVKLSGTTATVANAKNAGNAVVTTVLDSTYGAWDTYYVKVTCVAAGTVGTNGIQLVVSGDAGRNQGTPLALGTATTLDLGAPLNTVAVGGTGIRLSFTSGQTMVVGDSWTFATIGPQWNDAGITAAVNAFVASSYADAGVGSSHVVGVVPINSGTGNSDIATIQTAFNTATTQQVYSRAIIDLQDASGGGPGAATWGGTPETEATWIAFLETLASGSTADPRVAADGGHYNITSPYANPAFGQPAYRRPLSWAHAVRRTQIPLQRRAGRVKDGPYAQIVVSPAVDPTDGFIYHDERVNPGLNAARIGSAYSVIKKGRWFQCQEPLLCAPGSQFVELAIGNVLDAACDIAYAAGVEEVSDDLLTQANGTLDPVALNILQGEIQNPLNAGLPAQGLVSQVTATVVASANVEATGIIPVNVVVNPRAYVNSLAFTISLSNGG